MCQTQIRSPTHARGGVDARSFDAAAREHCAASGSAEVGRWCLHDRAPPPAPRHPRSRRRGAVEQVELRGERGIDGASPPATHARGPGAARSDVPPARQPGRPRRGSRRGSRPRRHRAARRCMPVEPLTAFLLGCSLCCIRHLGGGWRHAAGRQRDQAHQSSPVRLTCASALGVTTRSSARGADPRVRRRRGRRRARTGLRPARMEADGLALRETARPDHAGPRPGSNLAVWSVPVRGGSSTRGWSTLDVLGIEAHSPKIVANTRAGWCSSGDPDGRDRDHLLHDPAARHQAAPERAREAGRPARVEDRV